MSLSQRHYQNIEIADHKVSEKEKSEPEYLMAMTDLLIEDLVHENSLERREMLKMRAMRNGIRDPREYAYLTDNYGIGNPGSIRFSPVIRNRIDAVIGILSSAEMDWKMSIGDRESIQAADIEKSYKLLEQVYSRLEASVGQQSAVEQIDALVEKQKKDIASNWKSTYEINANNLLEYYRDNVDVNLKDIRKTLMEDLASVGRCLYRVVCPEYGQIPRPEVLIPENYYTEIRRDQKLYKESSRGVYVRYLSIEEIMYNYGHLMDDDMKEELLGDVALKHAIDLKSVEELEHYRPNDTRKDAEENYRNNTRYYKVYECEWIATNPRKIDKEAKKDLIPMEGPSDIQATERVAARYQSMRIGPDFYLNMGKSDFVMRSKLNPRKAYLSFNGMNYEHRNTGEPYSITWKCKDIQDMTDIMIYHRENLMANTGVNGSRIDVSSLPKFLGKDMMDRLMKAIALKKMGAEPYASSQDEGTAGNRGVSSDYRAGVEGNLLTAINSIISQLDHEATKLTGITPQMMGIIEQRDAVSNVKTGISQASIVMKNMYDQHDIVTKNMLTDLLNVTQLSLADHEEEFVGSFLVNEGYKSFTLDPRNFSKTDYNIHVVSSSNDYQKLNDAKNAANALASTGSVPPLLLMKIISSDSLTQLLKYVEEIEGDNSGQMLDELQKQVDQLMKDNEKLQKQLQSQQSAKDQVALEELAFKKAESQRKLELEESKARSDKAFQEKELALKEETVKLERDQLYMEAGGSSKEVRNDII